MAIIEGLEPRHESIGWAYRAVMLFGGVTVALTLTAISPVLPQIEAALAHGPGDKLMVKLLVTSVGLTMMVGAPLAGFITDRLGMRNVLLAACTLFALAGTAGLYLDSLPGLMISRLAVGAAAAAIATTSMTLINSQSAAIDRARWMGMHVSVATGGGLILQPAAGALGEIGWRWPFVLYGLGFVLAALVWFAPVIRGSVPPRDPVEQTRLSLWRWFPWRFALMAIGIGSITFVPVVYLPFVARQAGMTSPFWISMVGFADAVLGCVMALLFARARQRLSHRAAFICSFGFTAVGMVIAGTAHSFGILFAGMAVFGLGVGWFVPNLMTAAAACVLPNQQGRTVGVIKGFYYLAAPACTVLIEPVTRLLGPSSALLAGSILSIGLLASFLLSWTLRGQGHDKVGEEFSIKKAVL